jgi:hypothetical protein
MTMSHRQHIAMRELRQMREAEAAEIRERERAEAEKKERPLRQAEQDFQNTFKQYYAIKSQNLLTTSDEDFTLDKDAPVWFATQAEADAYNKAQADLFVRNNPDYYGCAENLERMNQFLTLQGVDRIVSAPMLSQAFSRLREFGHIIERPVEVPEPEPIPTPRREKVETARVPEPEQAGEWGFDPDTGQRLFKSDFDIARMSSEAYKRFKRLTPADRNLDFVVRR